MQWNCEDSGISENLWLNLSTGYIGSGRPVSGWTCLACLAHLPFARNPASDMYLSPMQHWDGTGGTGAALRYYQETGKKYPLAVKLGTITPSGADVYSYASDEDDMVLDPLLGEHLAHWGINMMQASGERWSRAASWLREGGAAAVGLVVVAERCALFPNFADGKDGEDHG